MNEIRLHFERIIVDQESDDETWQDILRRGADIIEQVSVSGDGVVTAVNTQVTEFSFDPMIQIMVRAESDEEVERMRGN